MRLFPRALLPLAALVAGLLAPCTPASAASSGSLQARIAALQASVAAAGARLEAGARAYEQGEQRLATLTQQQFGVADDLERQQRASTTTREDVDALVRAAYKGDGLPPTVVALLSGDPRALADLDRVRESVARVDLSGRAALHDLTTSRVRSQVLLADRTRLRREALAAQQALDARQQQLAAQAAQLAAQLTATSQQLQQALAAEAEAARQEAARRAAAAAQAAAERAAAVIGHTDYVPGVVAPGGGGGCAPPSAHGYANGFLPDAVLCPLPGRPGERLRTDAAQSFVAMDAARTAAGLPPLCITDSYRDYAGQVSVFVRKPGLAAVPGRSQHGWGLALDMCGGVERFDGEAHQWMLANAPRFGWVHPAWAEPGGSRPEAWHWEFLQGQQHDAASPAAESAPSN